MKFAASCAMPFRSSKRCFFKASSVACRLRMAPAAVPSKSPRRAPGWRRVRECDERLREASRLSPRPRGAAALAGGAALANSTKEDRRVAGVEAFDMNALVDPPGGVIAPGAPSSMVASVAGCSVCIVPRLPVAA